MMMMMMRSLVFAALLLAVSGGGARASYVSYNTSAGTVQGKLNVHLVPHTHDDVGWLKTVDQYYVGANNSIQGACVQNVLDSVVEALQKDPSRKFVYVEQAFFQRWWEEQNEITHEVVKRLVNSGQLDFINGGWCMHDEATVHYIDMIDQTTLGHRMIKKQFNKVPRTGWQIDPFGHSAVQGYLLGAELGFDSVHFARIDYQDRQKRWDEKSLEVIWRGSKTFGSSSQIFASAFPVHYSPPDGFSFEIDDESTPVQDDPLLYDYNVEQRVNDFIDAALSQADVTRTNHIMWTMGDDFMYQYAESWFRQMDKLINYVNKDGRVHALYSTPSIYVDAKNAANESWPLKTDDYFPYADSANAYWTGYYTSRPSFKRYVRMMSGYFLAARQLEFLVGMTSLGPFTSSLEDAIGLAQHHDAVSGTAKQHTTDDYAKRLAFGASEAEIGINLALSSLTSSSGKHASSAAKFSQCKLLNISYCPATEEQIPEGKSLVVVAYNSLGWNYSDYVRLPVSDDQIVVRDSTGTAIEQQFIEIDNTTRKLRNTYVKAYLGVSPNEDPKYWLVFQVSVPPLGWNTYFLSKAAAKAGHVSSVTAPDNSTVEIGPGTFKMSFSSSSGLLTEVVNHRTGVDVPMQQNYLWYGASSGDESDSQASGAYIFRPNGDPPTIVSNSVPLKVVRGPLVDEVHQQFSSWIYQVTRLYKDKEHAEIEYTIGPIPTDDGVGKEVITRLTSNMATNKTFYTDSNGRDFLKRVRDYREDWNLQVTQPIAGNYYPLNLGTYIADGKSELSVLVDRAVGGSSIEDGATEIMLHRRLLFDDGRGVGEPLNEQVCVNNACEGLVTRGNYHLSINQIGSGARWRRTSGQQIYSPLLLAFTHEVEESWKSSHITKSTSMDQTYSLPPNVALITLQDLDDGTVLIRLAHLYEAGEDDQYSALVSVDLGKIFAQKTIKEVKETSLSANQDKSEMKKLHWRVEGDGGSYPAPTRGGPISNSTLIVKLGPMEIRTFLLTF
ncbi:alpha-mannosidase [Iris pallida]|uniref:Alpha-mannosidase n=1 Tax=Iris pallida TaxID=29817 RepID=A0AAX6E0N9_IRIPA|nr:alpha-mannosidase [Iris pallida]